MGRWRMQAAMRIDSDDSRHSRSKPTGEAGMKQKQGLVGHALRVLSISILVAAQWVAAPVVHAGVKPQIVAAVQHGLALKSDGTVWTWGSNTFGELGDGTFTIRPSPVLVSGLSCVTAIAASGSHGLAVRCDGTVWAWGANHVGQLGLSQQNGALHGYPCLLYTSPSPRDRTRSRMPSSA